MAHKLMLHGLQELASGPPPREQPDANSSRPCQCVQPFDENQRPSQLHGHSP